jgi:hypothetical protein
MHEDLIFLYKAHFRPGTLLDGVSAGRQVLYFGSQRIIASRERLVGLFLHLDLGLELAHPLPPAFTPPKRVLRDGGKQDQYEQQQAHGGCGPA